VKQIPSPSVPDFEKDVRSGGHWVRRVQTIIVQQRRAPGSFERTPLRAG
jgi:hypothetical protein